MTQFNLVSVIAAILSFLVAFALTSTRSRASWFGFTLVVFFSSIGITLDYRRQLWEQWLLPVQTGRPVELAMTCLGLLIGVRLGHIRPTDRASLVVYMPIALGVIFGLVRVLHGEPEDALVSIFFALATGSAVVLFARRTTEVSVDARWLAKSLAAAGVIIGVCCAIQYVINPSRLVIGLNSRFIAMNGNPQFAGTFYASSGVALLWLSRGKSIFVKVLLLAATGISMGLVMWTGSRTGVASFAIGIVICSLRRFGASVALLPLVVVLFLGVQTLADVLGIELPLSRLFSTENTRSEAWSRLFDSFLRQPFVGVGGSELDASENSLLYAAASYGLVGATALSVAIVGTLVVCFRAWRASFQLPSNAIDSIDFVLALMSMMLFGALFEGYLVGRLGLMPMIWVAGVAVLDVLTKVDAPPEFSEPQSEGVIFVSGGGG
jgi:hypothetical protein